MLVEGTPVDGAARAGRDYKNLGRRCRAKRLAPGAAATGEAIPMNCMALKNGYMPPLSTSLPDADRSGAYG